MTKARMAVYSALGVATCCSAAVSFLCFFYAVSPWLDPKAIPYFGNTGEPIIFGSAGAAILLTSVYLLIGRRWAWWIAVTLSFILTLAGIIAIFAFLNPRYDYARMEGGFGLFLGLLFFAPGVTLLTLLLLPPVRQRFA